MSLTSSFKPNDHIRVAVRFNSVGNCDTVIRDLRNGRQFSAELSLEKYNEVVEFLKEYDHIYVINMLDQKYG